MLNISVINSNVSAESDPTVYATVHEFVAMEEDLTGTRFNVTVGITNVTDMGMWEIGLYWNSSLLDAEYVYETPDTANCTDWVPDGYRVDVVYPPGESPAINNTIGRVRIGALYPQPLGQGLNGDFEFVKIQFNIILAPPLGWMPPANITYSCLLDLNASETIIGDTYGMPISVNLQDGLYSYTRPQRPSAALADFTYYLPHPYVGDWVTLDASASFSIGGMIIAWLWEIAGPGTLEGANNTKVTFFSCDGPGIVNVTLSVWDDNSQHDTCGKLIEVLAPTPNITILFPQNKTYFTSSIPLAFATNSETLWTGYSLDNQANVTITGNTTLTGLAIGSHNIVIYANNTYGKMGASSKVYFTYVREIPIKGGENATIESNVTITEALVTENALRFDASGPSGLTGWINVTFPMVNTTDINVFINKEKLTPPPFPTITTNGTHYFIYFELTLSTHEITIQYATADIAVTNVVLSDSEAYWTWTIQVHVTVRNNDIGIASFKVATYYSSLSSWHEIGTQTVTDLPAGENTTVALDWSLAEFPDLTNYTVKANATLLDAEDVNPGDNEKVDGTVKIRLWGDVDGNDVVNILDLKKVKLGYFGWLPDPFTDIDGNGRINILDLKVEMLIYMGLLSNPNN